VGRWGGGCWDTAGRQLYVKNPEGDYMLTHPLRILLCQFGVRPDQVKVITDLLKQGDGRQLQAVWAINPDTTSSSGTSSGTSSSSSSSNCSTPYLGSWC
jgi:hypothetical protein